jgi:hypothetical protein
VGNACPPDRFLGVGARLVLELVDDVPVAGQRQARVVAELARCVDDAAALVQEQAGERVAQRIRGGPEVAGGARGTARVGLRRNGDSRRVHGRAGDVPVVVSGDEAHVVRGVGLGLGDAGQAVKCSGALVDNIGDAGEKLWGSPPRPTSVPVTP